MRILGIETSCDETAAAVVDDQRQILSSIIASQNDAHAAYGGVVPEIAARAHLEAIRPVVTAALEQAGMGFAKLDAIAATTGPGLIGGVMVGAMIGKAIAFAHDLPFLSINHLEAHALTARLVAPVEFPYLLLLVSGGHSALLLVRGVGRYRQLGTTIDDAAGECFDKVAKMLGLEFPGGSALESLATTGDALRYKLPRPLLGRAGCDFSFSGLKTAARLTIERDVKTPKNAADFAASFQAAMAAIMADRTSRALVMVSDATPIRHLVVAGGVAANGAIRAAMANIAEAHRLEFVAPPIALCTDNGAMVAWAGIERFRLGMIDDLSAPARPRWPLDPDAAA